MAETDHPELKIRINLHSQLDALRLETQYNSTITCPNANDRLETAIQVETLVVTIMSG